MYIVDSNCAGCGLCINECNFGAISLVNGKAEIDNALCRGCGICSDACPVGAIKWDDFSTAPSSQKQPNYSRTQASPARAQEPVRNKIFNMPNIFDSFLGKNREIGNNRGMGEGRGRNSGSRNNGRGYSRGRGQGSGRGMGRGRSL